MAAVPVVTPMRGSGQCLVRTQLEDLIFLLPTLEKVTVDSLEAEAVLETLHNDVPKTQIFPHL